MEYEPNQMSPVAFAVLHLYWGGLLYFFFMARLFGRLQLPGAEEPLSTEASQRLLLAIAIACIFLGFLAALERNRSNWRVALNVLTPFGIYLVLKTAGQDPIYLWVAALICVGVTLLYAAILLSAPIHHRKNKAFVLKMRFYQLTSATWRLSRMMLCLFPVVAIVGTVFGFSAIKPTETWDHVRTVEELGSVDLWEEQLRELREERWNRLTLQERVELMQLVADIESGYLGLPDALQVSSQSTAPNTLGFYGHETKSVCISRDHLLYDPPDECLDTMLHEVYHSYQHYLCALYEDTDDSYHSLVFLRAAREYVDEFENYTSGERDYETYYTQACESDAREYARGRGAVYQQTILSTQEEDDNEESNESISFDTMPDRWPSSSNNVSGVRNQRFHR